MHVIKCPDRRPKTIDGAYVKNATCNHELGFVPDLRDIEITLPCRGCGTYHKLVIKNKDPQLYLIPDNKSIDHKNILAYKINGYQIKGV